MNVFNQSFIEEAKALYPQWTALHEAIQNNSEIIGRYLDDAAENGIHYEDILRATSLEELKEMAGILKRKCELCKAYLSGSCYVSTEEARKNLGCPRLYAQNSDDKAALEAFPCYEVTGWIPDCKKFKTGECWKRFDELGLIIQGLQNK